MKLNETGIDMNAQPVSGDFEVLPKGRYKQQLTMIEVKQSDSGAVMVSLESEILEPVYEGRKVWTSINIVKKDGSINTIGNGQISALAKACGKSSIPNDEQVLLGIPHVASIAVEKGTAEYPNDKNKMVGFFPLPSEGKQIIAQKIAGEESGSDLPF